MVNSFDATGNRFKVVRDDLIAFDTDLPSLHLFPDYKLALPGVDIVFPNMLSSIVYRHGAQVGGASVCETWSGLMPQEWGPDHPDFSPNETQFFNNQNAPPTRNLPRSAIGSVPEGTDFIDVRAKIVRTLVPPVFKRIAPPLVMFPEGQWIHLVSGSCTCEYFAPLVRHFDITLSGTTIFLERYQSSRNEGQVSSTTGGNENGRTATQQGTQWGNYAGSPAQWATDCVFYEQRGLDGNGNKRPPWGATSSNSCIVGPVIDYQSHYSAEFLITPGRYA